jgi:DNA-binding NarL/FixJ family response regulator
MPITVVLSDDHAVVRDGLRMLLDLQSDLRVIGEAADGHEAIQLARLHHPHVMIMDIAMTGLDGIAATRQVRESCPATQVVMLSMYASLEHVARAMQAGALGYVPKESASAEIIAAVRAAYAGHQYLSQQIVMAREALLARPEVSPLQSLSAREREVLHLVVEGQRSAHIALRLGLSPKSVETYRSRLMHKLALKDLPSLVKFAIQHGVTSLE